MKHEPGVFEDPDPAAIEAADARAEADWQAGRYYENEVVTRWLTTWGTPAFKPFREWLESSG